MKKYFALAVIFLSACQKDAVVNTDPIDAKGEIYFISRRNPANADWQLFAMNADGSSQRMVTNMSVRCTTPVLSHSGTKIAFVNYDNSYYYNLYIIDTDGQHLQFLSKGKQYCGSPAWSPDDSRIVFVKNDYSNGGTADIYTIQTDGSNESKLTSSNDNSSPQFAPDNRSIYFSAYNNSFSGIYKMNPDGSNKQLLTPASQSFGNPVFSPSGNQLAVTLLDWGGSQIFVMNADGSNLKQLTYSVSPRYFDIGFPRDGNYSPAWSPDGSKLAYVSWENASPDIFVINANGSGNTRLTDTPLRDESPVWSKDGNYIIFSSNRDLNVSSEIYIMRSQGQLQTPLTHYASDDIFPVFLQK